MYFSYSRRDGCVSMVQSPNLLLPLTYLCRLVINQSLRDRQRLEEVILPTSLRKFLDYQAVLWPRRHSVNGMNSCISAQWNCYLNFLWADRRKAPRNIKKKIYWSTNRYQPSLPRIIEKIKKSSRSDQQHISLIKQSLQQVPSGEFFALELYLPRWHD